ncbi:MAG: bifunctional proline dehydrogenase/L-glutamate gamma-semialdehyde dehydrogenase [Verrucomicrobiales bacterium]|nr:bifunctional proline dehydrogenase/L-glutamate gamma-semialdehyde dehydrogenase [Verrucomicrobiales bacterium]
MDETAKETIATAEALLKAARQQETGRETAEGLKLARMMLDAPGKAFTFAMVDQVFRSHDRAVQAERLRHLLRIYGMPAYLTATDRVLMKLGALASRWLPALVMPAMEQRMRKESAGVVILGGSDKIITHLERRKREKFRANLNQLGEAVLGEEEAERRMQAILTHLKESSVTYISVKISAIFSQIHLPAWDQTLEKIKERLRRLYRAAAAQRKFVNLDMEEYRDLLPTLLAFCDVLGEEEFFDHSAGIVLQAYLPDSWQAQRELTEWARDRVARGGAPVKLRLVKGANLAMEAVEAEQHGWHSAPYPSKVETDANFRRMLEFACQPENAAAVRVGVASHNLFDVALALTLRRKLGVADAVEIEMLEGMANPQARAVRDSAGGLLLYSPTVRPDDFLSAMAYLVRRLDENTAPDNFLHDLFALEPGSPVWRRQEEKFLRGWEMRGTVSADSRRERPAAVPTSEKFENEPDSDWTQPPVREALQRAVAQWQAPPLPALEDLDTMLDGAVAAGRQWAARPVAQRAAILHEAARVMSAQRFEALACLRLHGKKSTIDADAEVSEAIDFARYYAKNFELPGGLEAEALGVVAVTPPWNFPYAIPCGGVLAALMAGNAVLLKPAPETVELGWLLARQLWEAGVPREVLRFFPCPDGELGRRFLTDSRIAAVVLTGAYETARMFQDWRPSLRLFAETSGKNALVITAQADREQAIKDLVRSAFGHSGQKCSAASLAIVEAEVYDDPAFRRQLCDAAASLPVGPATDPASIVTPLIREASPDLLRGLTKLDAGESWLLEPRQNAADPCLWSPGIRLGVLPGSWFHQTECFGPVLGLMRAENLDQAIAWQNATEFGLTAGIHSLDDREITRWKSQVQAGNLYINRPITGAIVQRQPFGGWKRSSIGAGAKAGGPNYAWSFCRISDCETSGNPDMERHYHAAWAEHFQCEHDPSGLRCESNHFRYRPCRGVILRLDGEDQKTLARCRAAARLVGVPLVVSLTSQESDEAFAARLGKLAGQAEFLRTVTTPPDAVLRAAHAAGLNWIDAPATANGRMELRFWLREQAVSECLHRYGHLPEWSPAQKS